MVMIADGWYVILTIPGTALPIKLTIEPTRSTFMELISVLYPLAKKIIKGPNLAKPYRHNSINIDAECFFSV
jgi:hypothetical protein